MMKFLKEKKSIIISFIIGVILASNIAVYASINASDVDYKNGQKVSQALDDLYNKQKEYIYTETQYQNYGIAQRQEGYEEGQRTATVATTKTLLWTNSSANSNFVTDEISTFSITNFTHILIQWKQNTSSSTIYEDICKTNPIRQISSTAYFTIGENDDDGYFIRNILWNTQGNLTIANAVSIEGSGVNNSKLIPIAIYGLNFSY